MQVIPVLDIKDGVAVRAVAGRRSEYRPISSALSASAVPSDVVSAYLDRHAFESIYVADLDGIEHGRAHLRLLDALHEAHSGLSFWIDSGFESPDDLARIAGRSWLHPVVGSESQRSFDGYQRLMESWQAFELGPPRLSLDFNDRGFIGPVDIERQPGCWPPDIIVMTLDKVGVNRGPAVSRLRQIAERARAAAARPECRVYAAGGVRGRDDLGALAGLGCAGVLVASALHDGSLTSADLEAFAGTDAA